MDLATARLIENYLRLVRQAVEEAANTSKNALNRLGLLEDELKPILEAMRTNTKVR